MIIYSQAPIMNRLLMESIADHKKLEVIKYEQVRFELDPESIRVAVKN